MPARIALLSFAHLHAHAYAACLRQCPEQAQIAGIYDDEPERGSGAAQQYGTQFFDTVDSLLAEDLDGFIICSENAKHKDLVLHCVEHGKPILCEKPISTNVPDAQAMIEACSRSGAPLMIAFPVRFSVPVFRARQWVQNGKLGRVLAMRGTNRGTMPGGWFADKSLAGGGAVMDHTVHVVDAWRWMTGKEPVAVYAEAGQLFYTDYNIDDAGLLSIEFEGGIFATLDTSWSRPNKAFPTWGDVTMEIILESGTLSVDAFRQRIEIYNNDAVKAQWDPWTDDVNFGLIQSFLKVVNENAPLQVTGHDGLKAMEAALGAYRSLETGQPVSLPLA